MQFVTCTDRSPLLKPIASQGQLVKPCIASNLLNVVDESVPCLDQRGTITFMVPALPSMLDERIDEELMFSAKVTRTRIKLMKL